MNNETQREDRWDWPADVEFMTAPEAARLLNARAAEIERLSKEIENLIWNLGGCDTIASGWSKPFDYNKEMARPALDSVSRLATKLEAAESKLSQLQLSNDTDRLLEKVSDYRSGYSCGYSDAKNGTRMRDKDAATAFFGLDREGSIPDILNGGQQ